MSVLRIKEIRESRNMTQAELAATLKVARTTVTNWEAGDRLPRVDQLPAIARVFDVSIDKLFISETA